MAASFAFACISSACANKMSLTSWTKIVLHIHTVKGCHFYRLDLDHQMNMQLIIYDIRRWPINTSACVLPPRVSYTHIFSGVIRIFTTTSDGGPVIIRFSKVT